MLSAILACVVLPAALPAAERQPPLLALANPNFGLVSGDILRVQDQPPAIFFAVREVLRGDAPAELQLLVDRHLLSRLSPGPGYLAVYSDLEAAPLKPKQMRRVAERSRLMSFDGVELSLFRDTPMWRKALMADPIKRATEADYRAEVFAGLSDNDPQWCQLMSAELALRAQRLSPYTEDELALIEQLVGSPQAPVLARATLLQAAADRSPLLGADWYIASAAGVLADTAPRTEVAIGEDQLIYAALRILTAHPNAVDGAVAESWLAGTPALAESAALVLRGQSPELERAALDRVLARALLSATTRQFLEQHRQRLPIAAASLSPGKE